jgi:hypothetical protein
MSAINLTLAATTLTAAGNPLTLTGSVTNSATVPARVVLAAFSPDPTAAQASAKEWTAVDRPLREIGPGATEQYTITVTPPAEAPSGEHAVRFIAYDADRPPEEYSDQARVLRIVVPARQAPPPTGTPWWIWVAAAALVVVVGVIAFLLLRPQAEPELPSPPPSTPTSVPPTPTATATPTKVLPTKVLPTKALPTKLPPKATAVPTKIPTAKAQP